MEAEFLGIITIFHMEDNLHTHTHKHTYTHTHTYTYTNIHTHNQQGLKKIRMVAEEILIFATKLFCCFLTSLVFM